MTFVDPRIFRAYDIRGRVPEQLNADACRLVGKAFGTVLRRAEKTEHPVVIVGRDARTHGPELEAALIDGLTSTGCVVRTIGPTPTPVNYFTVATTDVAGGVQVTASHNPAHDNGLKLASRGMHAFSGEELQSLLRQIEAGDFVAGEGSVEPYDAVTPYRKSLITKFDQLGKNMRVIVDSGNGIAGPVNCDVLRAVGFAVQGLFIDPDGTFPNHPADPSKHSTLKDLQEAVLKTGAHLGVAFDGDGDRVGIVDETGTIRNADEVLLLLAKDFLARHPGGTVVSTVSNSSLLQTEIEAWGGKAVMCKVGHSHVEHAMAQHQALLGGEQSGHFFCAEDTGGYDDALVAALRVLFILAKAKKPASTLFADFPKVYQTPEHRPHCDDDQKRDVVARITAHFTALYPVNTLDGVRIDFGDGAWAGIRFSNTSPCLSVCIEARSKEKLEAVEKEVMDHLKTYNEIDWGK